jgi:putative salt-induced outer membrane protein
MHTLRVLTASSFMLLAAITALAGQIVLKNGDRLTGAIEKSDGKTIVIKTDYAGELTVKIDAVQTITSTEPLHVALKTGQTITGSVAVTSETLTVTPSGNSATTAQMSEVTAIRDNSAQATYEKAIHPRFIEDWDLGTNVGFALTRGNSETSNLAIAFTAVRQTKNDKLAAYANTIYATDDAPGANPSAIANTTQAGIRYDHDLTNRIFGFAGADFMTNGLQELNLRSVFGGGVGYHAIKRPNTTLDILLGAGYTHESYTTVTNSFANAIVGEEFTRKLLKSTTVDQTFYFYPNLNQTGQYRGTFNLGVVTKISSWLGWQTAFGDIYVSNPPVSTKQNDIILTTGLNFAFSTK